MAKKQKFYVEMDNGEKVYLELEQCGPEVLVAVVGGNYMLTISNNGVRREVAFGGAEFGFPVNKSHQIKQVK